MPKSNLPPEVKAAFDRVPEGRDKSPQSTTEAEGGGYYDSAENKSLQLFEVSSLATEALLFRSGQDSIVIIPRNNIERVNASSVENAKTGCSVNGIPVNHPLNDVVSALGWETTIVGQ